MPDNTTSIVHTEKLKGVISDEIQRYLDLYLGGVAVTCLAFTGLITNVINIIVFIRQGAKDSVTISLLSLSVSDLGGNMFNFFCGLCQAAKAVRFMENEVDWAAICYVCFGWYRAACYDISMLTTVYISVERCLSIIMPLKIKGIFTTSRARIALLCIYAFIIACFLPSLSTQGLKWVTSETNNATILSLNLDYKYRLEADIFINATVAIMLPTVSYIVIVFCTLSMIRGLRKAAAFRSRTTTFGETGHQNLGQAGEGQNLSQRDLKVVKMVLLVACVFITCTFPQVINDYARRFMTDVDPGKRYNNMFWTLYYIIFCFTITNASINMFIYLSFSSKYKEVFSKTFCSRRAIS